MVLASVGWILVGAAFLLWAFLGADRPLGAGWLLVPLTIVIAFAIGLGSRLGALAGSVVAGGVGALCVLGIFYGADYLLIAVGAFALAVVSFMADRELAMRGVSEASATAAADR